MTKRRLEALRALRRVQRRLRRRACAGRARADAPWIIVEGADERYRTLTVGEGAPRQRCAQARAPARRRGAHGRAAVFNALDERDVLRARSTARDLDPRRATSEQLDEAARRGSTCSRARKRFRKRSVVAVFEGMDAAGKGGAIRRVTGALDARQYHVIPIAAPTEEERAQPYLWRFWRHLPRQRPPRDLRPLLVRARARRARRGLLLARPTGCAPTARSTTSRSSSTDNGIDRREVLAARSRKDEQLRRFKEREETGFKRFKITAEDWRNREKWDAYERAVCDMVDRTSTEIAPWTLVEANDKHFARIKVLKTLCTTVREALQ